ncbi:hypothetical protein CHS0354_037879 [Potamilus streckersoni]|uniref:Uncharacterized protein n=1 Tax=Potamilus streckersoni TaxID=2493646 RepID=A0AAE0W9B6_9BIVA|nr:hypothetical protein CHS0354_037879 [Potamilus streckersoni]
MFDMATNPAADRRRQQVQPQNLSGNRSSSESEMATGIAGNLRWKRSINKSDMATVPAREPSRPFALGK